MTIPRKGSRRIVVDGTEYRWRVRHRPTYSQLALGHTLSVAIDIGENPQCTLLVDLSRAHLSNALGEPSTPVTPLEVSNLIRNARIAGWNPTEPGSAFKMFGEHLASQIGQPERRLE
ncbi:MAG: hypothetical protein K8T91_10020 [Planctomycetes bacterium]|nr:hypothetical protein [Planctomycetota bacterium]